MMKNLLSRLAGRRPAPAPAAATRVRRAHQAPSRKEPIDAPRPDVPAIAPPAVLEVVPVPVHHEPAPIDITSEKQLPNWRAVLGDVVRDKTECVVLDLEFRSVMVLGTPAHFGSGAHGALMSTLAGRHLSVDSEKTTTKEVIKAVLAIAEHRLQSNPLGVVGDTGEANVQLYKDLVSGAFALGGSDLHILLDLEGRTTVRVRIDGKSKAWRTFDTHVLNAALGAAYQSLTIRGTNSNSDWTLDRPINTMTRFNDGNTVIHGRLSTQPCTGGCKVTIRVSDGDTNAIAGQKLEDSGYTHEQIHQQILPALAKDKGFILVGGSTGSGKTTTLQRMIMAIPGREWKEIVAVEDPNEARIPGVAHHSIQRNTDDPPEKVKVQFDSAFMTQMRMDPDVIIIGEIRDRTSADLATDAVLTGHLLAVTMHGNSAIGQLFRLMNDRIGMSSEVLADEDNFVLSMAQYLVPRLCEHCKVPAHDVMPDDQLSILRTKWRLDTRTMFCASGTGCEHCAPEGLQGDGERGRIAAAEIITRPTKEFLNCLLNRDRVGANRAWRVTRRADFDSPDMQGKTSFENALYHVSQGIVSPLSLPIVFGKSYEDVEVVEVPGILHLAAERAA